MTNAYVMTGTLTDQQTIRLNEPLPFSGGDIRVVIEVIRPSATTGNPAWKAVMEPIWEEQRRRGHIPPTAEEVQKYIRGEQDSWGD
jgi:hypothetical protein